MTPYIDRSREELPRDMPPAPVADAWVGSLIDPLASVVHLDATARRELAALADHVRANPLPFTLRDRADHDIPALERAMARVDALLDGVPGVAVVDRLDLDAVDRDTACALFWILGQFVGRQVAQKWDGTMLYDVTDAGAAFGYGVRGSRTNVELVFHVDNAFALAPPDRVGLMCFHPAREGGVSRFCSLPEVHNRLLEAHPVELQRLYRSMYFDRQAEHAPGAPAVLLAPMFHRDGDHLTSRANVALVRKGYDVAGETMDRELERALAVLESVSRDPALWFELPIERGQLQFLNNRTTAHYRSEFVDHEEPEKKRHLVRSWHRDWGAVSYDA